MAAKKYTQQKFAEAFGEATSINELIRRLGLSNNPGSGHYRQVTRLASQYGFDLNQIKQRRKPTLSSVLENHPQKVLEAIQNSSSLTTTLNKLGVSRSSGNYRRLRTLIRRQGLVSAQWKNPTKKPIKSREAPSSEIFRLNGRSLTGRALMERLIRDGNREYACENCDTGYMHNGEVLRLQIHHINSNPRDNRLENLAILCPNCHTQTEFSILDSGMEELQKWVLKLLTYKNTSKDEKTEQPSKPNKNLNHPQISTTKTYPHVCMNCNKSFMGISRQKYCTPACYHASTKGQPKRVGRKVKNRPTLEEIRTAVENTNWSAAAKKWTISDNCLRKWVRLYGADPKSIISGSKFGPKKL